MHAPAREVSAATDGRELVAGYIAAGYRIVTWPQIGDTKGPKEAGWTTKLYTLEDYQENYRVGVVTGSEIEVGKFIHDVDIDWAPGSVVAQHLLPVTEFVFGRQSKKISHCFYTTPEALPSVRFEDIDKTTLIELRGTKTSGELGLQTMVPPSVWSKDGHREPLAFVKADKPSHLDSSSLTNRVRLAAIAMLLAKQLGKNGFGHEPRLAWAGFLLRAGMPAEDIIAMGEAMSVYCNNKEVEDVRRVVESTAQRLTSDTKKVSGGPALAKIIGTNGEAVIDRIKKWLGIEGADAIYADRVDPQTVDRVWERLVERNNPPSLFRRNREIVMPVAEEIISNFDHLFARQLALQIAQECREREGAQFATVSPDLFTELLARSVPFVREVGRGKNRYCVETYPSKQLVKQIMASPICPLPLARGIIRTPSFDAHGHLLCEPGYHAASGMFYAPPPGFTLPDLPPQPTREDVDNALALWNEVVGEFPFVDDASRAHVLALPITVLVREMIRGPVPMCLVTKPVTGTGATLLLQVAGWIVLGESLPESSWSSNQEELRKYLTTLLMRGRPLVNLDNITYLHSKDLLSVLSGDVREDRRLGGNELLTIPNRAVFVGSGNNVTYNDEHAGRLYVVRLDPKDANPRLSDRTFKHPQLAEWVKEHRPELVAALLTIARAWIAAGKPTYTGTRLAGFEAWSNVVGGILQHAGVKGFLANRDQVMRNAQASQEEDVEFVAAWYECMNATPPTLEGSVKTKDILTAPGMLSALPTPRTGTIPTAISLGRYLERNVDRIRVLDGGTTVAIRRADEDTNKHTQRWKLEALDAKPEPPIQQQYDDDIPF